MIKQVIGILILMLLIISAFNSTCVSEQRGTANTDEINTRNITMKSTPFDEVDQFQMIDYNEQYHIDTSQSAAQSFIPTLNVLTRTQLFMFEWNPVDYELLVSIRKDLHGDDLTKITLIPEGWLMEKTWIEFDFDDIAVTPGETYYIVCIGLGGDMGGPGTMDNWCYGWGLCKDGRSYPNGCSYLKSGSSDRWVKDAKDYDCCFVTRGYNDPDAYPDLECHGNLRWANISLGGNVTGNFTVENVGFVGSVLDWEIISYPEWGTWTFEPESGEDLTPGAGQRTVEVSVVAPEKKNTGFGGKIVLVNKDNTGDRETILVTLTTTKSCSHNFGFLRDILRQYFLSLAAALKI